MRPRALFVKQFNCFFSVSSLSKSSSSYSSTSSFSSSSCLAVTLCDGRRQTGLCQQPPHCTFNHTACWGATFALHLQPHCHLGCHTAPNHTDGQSITFALLLTTLFAGVPTTTFARHLTTPSHPPPLVGTFWSFLAHIDTYWYWLTLFLPFFLALFFALFFDTC